MTVKDIDSLLGTRPLLNSSQLSGIRILAYSKCMEAPTGAVGSAESRCFGGSCCHFGVCAGHSSFPTCAPGETLCTDGLNLAGICCRSYETCERVGIYPKCCWNGQCHET